MAFTLGKARKGLATFIDGLQVIGLAWSRSRGLYVAAEGGESTGALIEQVYDSGTVDLETGGAATAIAAAIPVGAVILGVALEVVDAITGIDSTAGTLAFTGGNTDTVGAIAAFTAGTTVQRAVSGSEVASSVAGLAFTLSGGSDNTPTAGSIRVVVHYATVNALA